jgi:hypothetical protein
MALSNTFDSTIPVSVRLPIPLASELQTIAAREHNGISSTIRRLLSAAIALEHRAADGRHEHDSR